MAKINLILLNNTNDRAINQGSPSRTKGFTIRNVSRNDARGHQRY